MRRSILRATLYIRAAALLRNGELARAPGGRQPSEREGRKVRRRIGACGVLLRFMVCALFIWIPCGTWDL